MDKHNNNFENENQMLHQNSFAFRICDIQLPIVASAYVHVLLSLRHPNYACIGTTRCIRTRIQMHNAGNGAIDIDSACLRPFASFACVYGFVCNQNQLRFL